MVKVLVDTNILIDFLQGRLQAKDELDRHDDPAISIVTWMEVMVGAKDGEADAIRVFLTRFEIANLDGAVAEMAVKLRRLHRLKLPDAIIWATAMRHGRLLVTRDGADFPPDDPSVRIPYAIKA